MPVVIVLRVLETRIPSACGNLKGNITEAHRDPSIPPSSTAPASSLAQSQGQERRDLPAWNYFMIFYFFFSWCPSRYLETRCFNQRGTMAHYSLDFFSYKDPKAFLRYPGGD